MRWQVGGAAVLMMALAAPAGAAVPKAGEIVFDVTPQEMADIANAIGHNATVTEDADGAYVDVTDSKGLFYWIGFLHCDEQTARCTDLTFNASWVGPSDADYVHRWNSDNWYGTAIVGSDGGPILVWTVTIDGGVSRAWMDANLGLWSWMLGEFDKYTADDPSQAAASSNPPSGSDRRKGDR